MTDLMRVHRTLCSPFVAEELYRNALGGGRADLSTVGRYLASAPMERSNVSFYFDRSYYMATNLELDRGTDGLLHFSNQGLAQMRLDWDLPPYPPNAVQPAKKNR